MPPSLTQYRALARMMHWDFWIDDWDSRVMDQPGFSWLTQGLQRWQLERIEGLGFYIDWGPGGRDAYDAALAAQAEERRAASARNATMLETTSRLMRQWRVDWDICMICEDDFSWAQLGLLPHELRQLERLGWNIEDNYSRAPNTTSS